MSHCLFIRKHHFNINKQEAILHLSYLEITPL